MLTFDKIGIIADDLTGANDTALQFFMRNCETQILLNFDDFEVKGDKPQVFALPTESRNISPENAVDIVKDAAKNLKNAGIEKVYKKIDSTMRGNIAQEALVVVETMEYDAAIILPAFPVEGRTTIGGYHMLKGVPIQRTELARDILFPIYDSHIPTILKKQLPQEKQDSVGIVGLDVVMKGAGPILVELNEQIKYGKKLIVVDAVSVVDIEQIVLAINKINYKILPCGSAGLAQSLANIWLTNCDTENKHRAPIVPSLPKLVISGSATELTASQIKKLIESSDVEKLYNIPITADDILQNNITGIVEKAIQHLNKDNTVIIHSADIQTNSDEFIQSLFEKEVSTKDFISKISQYLALITSEILAQKEVILITVGGETSYKCAKDIDSKILRVLDAVSPAIPLCIDNNNRYIVTKSGNLGTMNTLVEILNYFEHEE